MHSSNDRRSYTTNRGPLLATFLKLLKFRDKVQALNSTVAALRSGENNGSVFSVEPNDFQLIPKAPFAYWAVERARTSFQKLQSFDSSTRKVKVGDHPGDGFRYLRLYWEIAKTNKKLQWVPYQKGGIYSPFYCDIHLVANWDKTRSSYRGFFGRPGRSSERPSNYVFFFRPGLTWPRRTTSGLSMRVMPAGCVFADKGPAVLVSGDAPERLLGLLSITNSLAFRYLVGLQLAAADAAARSYEVGVIQRTPVPELRGSEPVQLSGLAREAWSLKRKLDTVDETSHAFILPERLRDRIGEYFPSDIQAGLSKIQAEIDGIVLKMYGFDEIDGEAIENELSEFSNCDGLSSASKHKIRVNSKDPGAELSSLMSWCVGVVFGRFDWRLASGEREAPSEPEPFDALPAKSPGMLPDGEIPYHAQLGVLVDDPGHAYDLAGLIESLLEQVNLPISNDIRRWLQRSFFKEHLRQYSKSRRKAPIYWPLSTISESYTLWVYYPDLTSQTLYTLVNDFLDPKLVYVVRDIQAQRSKIGLSKDEIRELEHIQMLEVELKDLRQAILEIAKDYVPDQNDGVQITAAPLWPLFQHKPWQKVLQETWKKLEKGDYDWAQLAMNYWPERVKKKCKTDKSLAIAHGLDDLYSENATN